MIFHVQHPVSPVCVLWPLALCCLSTYHVLPSPLPLALLPCLYYCLWPPTSPSRLSPLNTHLCLLQVNLAGYKGHHCPTDEEGFLDFARSLPSPVIYDTLLQAKPVSPISTYAATGNFRRLFEAAPPPNGLCVIGDATCYFNPINVRTVNVSRGSTFTIVVIFTKAFSFAGLYEP